MSEVRDQVVLALSHEIHIDEAHGFPAGYTAEQRNYPLDVGTGTDLDSPRWLEDLRLEGRPSFIYGRERDLMQIPDEIRKCVAFAVGQSSDGFALHGTVFFVSEPIGDSGRTVRWWVTAAHVVNKIKSNNIDGKLWVRMNTVDGKSRLVPTELEAWTVSDDKDVAVIPLSLGHPLDHLFYPLPEATKPDDLSLGDELVFVGLFSGHPGNVRNVPIIRVGNIAAMPGEPIKLKNWGNMVAYLAEARSIGGLSGAPVFAVPGPVRSTGSGAVRMTLSRGQPLHLIGLMHGHFDAEGEITVDADVSAEKGREIVNMGISVVVPLDALVEVINMPKFVDEKARALKRWEDSQPKVTEDTSAVPLATDDANLTRADFESALRKVSRRKPSSPDEGTSGT